MWIVWTGIGRSEHKLEAKTAHHWHAGKRRTSCGRIVPDSTEAIVVDVSSSGRQRRCEACSRRSMKIAPRVGRAKGAKR